MLKKIVLGLLGLVVLAAAGGFGFVMVQVSAFDESMAKTYDFPLTEVQLTDDAVALNRGKHLVESLGACTACHGDNLGGGREEPMGPVGKVVYPNVTGSKDGRLSAYSDAELMRLFRHGVKKDGTSVRLMPVYEMSWWPDADWVAVISYLRRVQPVAGQKASIEITTMGKVLDRLGSVPFDTARRIDHTAKPSTVSPAESVEYGKLVAVGCRGCHGEEHLSGGRIPGTPPEIPMPLNLTPHETGLKGWSYEDFVQVLRTGVRKSGQPLNPFMPIAAFKNLDETELKALWAYLGSLPPVELGEAVTTGGTPTNDSAAQAQRAVRDQALHAETVRRFRTAVTAGAIVWPAFLAVDIMALETFGRGATWSSVLGPRIAFTVIAWSMLAWVLRQGDRLSWRAMVVIDQAIYGMANVLIGVMCWSLGGLKSPYIAGACLVVTARMLSLPYDWRRALAANALPVLATPLTVVAGAIAFHQPYDADALGIFALNVGYLVTTGVFMAVGSHLLNALRKELSAERNIGKYKLRKRLGLGGMGEVWAAWHSSLKRDVALKILKTVGADANAAARFEREVRATSELTHPNTVRVFDYGAAEGGLLYYAMELLRGEDLSALVKREGKLDAARAVFLLRQAARALAEAHERGIVHRDVKPENLFVTTAGGEGDFVKVLDFGIARIESADLDPEAKLTQADAVMGTPRYMAPEAMRGEQAGPRADVYGLGAVLYLTLTGAPPFEGPTRAAMVGAVLSPVEAPPVPHVSAELAAVVARALTKDSAARFANARALSDALDAVPEAGRWKPQRTEVAAEPPSLAPDDAAQAIALATPMRGTSSSDTVTSAVAPPDPKK